MSTPANQVIPVTTQTNVIQVVSPGPQGPTGPMGTYGPTGAAGGPTGPTGPSGIPTSPEFNISVTANLPSGSVFNFAPFGYIPGYTNCLILTPADSTSVLYSLAATSVPSGFSILLVNASLQLPLQIFPTANHNGFLTPSGNLIGLPPLSATIAVWIKPPIISPGNGYWMVSGPTAVATQLVTGSGTGAVTATANYNTNVIILDGVSSTFALTFPVGGAIGQSVEVLFNTLVSAFSVVAGDAYSTINNVPTSGAAGTGIAWYYVLSNLTWYRQY